MLIMQHTQPMILCEAFMITFKLPDNFQITGDQAGMCSVLGHPTWEEIFVAIIKFHWKKYWIIPTINWLADVQMQCHQLGKVLVLLCFLSSQAYISTIVWYTNRCYAPCQHMMSIVETWNFSRCWMCWSDLPCWDLLNEFRSKTTVLCGHSQWCYLFYWGW